MGLAERRAVQTLKETDFKAFEAKMKTICGFDIKLNFDFAALEAHPDCVRIICEQQSHDGFRQRTLRASAEDRVGIFSRIWAGLSGHCDYSYRHFEKLYGHSDSSEQQSQRRIHRARL